MNPESVFDTRIVSIFNEFTRGHLLPNQMCRFAVSSGLRKLIETGYSTSHLPFNELVALLYADCVGARRNRLNLGDVSFGETAHIPSRDNGDLIGWRRENIQSPHCIPTMSDIVRGYVNGDISTSFFRKFLQSKHIQINRELDQLIRRHESDNASCFQEFACVLLRMGVEEMRSI